jgi:hypothetical protein
MMRSAIRYGEAPVRDRGFAPRDAAISGSA